MFLRRAFVIRDPSCPFSRSPPSCVCTYIPWVNAVSSAQSFVNDARSVREYFGIKVDDDMKCEALVINHSCCDSVNRTSLMFPSP